MENLTAKLIFHRFLLWIATMVVCLAISTAMYFLDDNIGFAVFLVGALVCIGAALYSLSRYFWAKIKDTDKIYEARFVKVNASRRGRMTYFSVELIFTDASGNEVNAKTDYLFWSKHLDMLQESNGFKIAHRQDGGVIILQIL